MNKKLLITIFALTLIGLASMLYGQTAKDFIVQGKVLIEYKGSATAVVIPTSLGVTEIGWHAFYDCTSLTSVTIPAGVTSIGERAFWRCNSLASVTIPNSVTSIGGGAFQECASLKSITIPNSVTSIEESAFAGTSLANITVGSGNPNYASEGGILYNKAKTEIKVVPQGISGNVTIPDSVTSIGGGAFGYCSSLASVTIGNSVISIGNYAFRECTNLTSVTIGNSVTSIGYSAFYNCDSLASVTFEGTIASSGLDGSAFSGDLRTKYLAGGIGTYIRLTAQSKEWRKEKAQSEDDFIVKQIPGNAIAITGYKGSVRNLVIPATLYGLKVTTIGNRAFEDQGLTSVVIPDSVTEIEDGVFNIDNIWVYSYGAFVGNKLESVTLGKGLKKIGSFAFGGNKELKEVVIPDSVTVIEVAAFYNCGITKVTFGNGLKKIEKSAFASNKELKEVVIPDSVTEIAGGAFKDCGITKLTLGKNVVILNGFENNQLTELAIPPSVKSIGGFSGNQIKTLTIPNTVQIVYGNAFASNPIETLVIPASLAKRTYSNRGDIETGIGAYVFGDCPLTRITMPANMDDYPLSSGRDGAGFDQNFVTFYKDQKKAAGTYVKRGPIWTKE
jgi:hypothetical protein